MEQVQPFSAEFEEQVRAVLTVPDPQEQEFLTWLKVQVLEGPASQPVRRQWFAARLAWGVALGVVMLFLISFLAIGPQRVLAQVQRWLGYVPEIGFVETGEGLRVLQTPVTQERDGVTITVEQVVADADRTTVVYTVEGLGLQHRPDGEAGVNCAASPLLRSAADGKELFLNGGQGNGWPSGYRAQLVFPPLAKQEKAVTLLIPCLENTSPGTAPEDWEIHLALQPAPEGFQALPVIEVGPTTAATQGPDPAADLPAGRATSAEAHGVHFQVERLVELEDGYLIQGSLDWQNTEFGLAGFSAYELQVRDAAGHAVLVEPADDAPGELKGDPYAQKRQTWRVRTASRQYSSPLTLTLPSVTIDQAVDLSFELDLGANPQPRQTWELDQVLEVEGREVTVKAVSLVSSPDGRAGTYGLDFSLYADPDQLLSVSLWDPDNHSARIVSSGGFDGRGMIRQSFTYDTLPTGLHRIQITQAAYPLHGPWTVFVDLPSSTPGSPVPTQPAACLTAEGLTDAGAESPSLPDGLGGRLLVAGPAMEGVYFPTLYVTDLEGKERITVGPGGWADLSPDGQKVIYSFSDGLHLADLESGENRLLGWAGEKASAPVWSPDGGWIAFMSSDSGISIARPDGSDLRQVPGGGVSTALIGWHPDGKELVVTTLGAGGSVLQTIDLESGEVREHFTIDNLKGGFGRLAPDGRQVAFVEMVFGQPAYGAFIANLDGSGKRLVASLGSISVNPSAWSPDGLWLLVTGIEATLDGSRHTNYLVQPDTCTVLLLEELGTDKVLDWSQE